MAQILARLLLLSLAFAVPSAAAEVFRAEVDGRKIAVRLLQEDCANEQVRAYLYDSLLDIRRFRKATSDWGGEFWEGCWVDIKGMVITVWSDRSTIRPIPRNLFKDEAI
ncbi:MAG TPA: hypothetical protein VM489_17725 [Burkholderiales bacterium]|nr:hypothetical protein [Burkholderiales bacterium]